MMRRIFPAVGIVLLAATLALAARIYTERALVGWKLVVEQDVDGTIRALVSYATTDDTGRVLSTESVDALTLVTGAQRTACRQCISAIRKGSYDALGLPTPTPVPTETPGIFPLPTP